MLRVVPPSCFLSGAWGALHTSASGVRCRVAGALNTRGRCSADACQISRSSHLKSAACPCWLALGSYSCLPLRKGGSPAPCGGCCLNICRTQALATARILRIGLRASCLTQVGPASQTPFPLWVTAVCIAPRQALYLLLFVCLGEAPDISLLFHSPLTLRSTAAPCGLCLRFSSDLSLPVTKGCLREQALGWQTSPTPGVFAAALPALLGWTECGFADWPGAAACCWAVSPACLLCVLVSDGD